jgi:hemerythrin-like domain-containing protein
MSDTIMLLKSDHGNMARVLALIQQQVQDFARGAPVNRRLLETTFAYLSEYPDRCHHPKEELVYRKLLGRCPEMEEALGDLVGEHDELKRLTESLGHALRESRRERRGLDEPLADRLMEFVEFYRRHMIAEEQQFFPAALQLLSRDNFDEIDFTVFDQPDPLFDQETEGRFVELRDEILRVGRDERLDADIRGESAWLASLGDLAAFNVAMERIDESIRLIHASSGGYDLEREGKRIVHIPECDESRAAWCAYFFWKGSALK